MHPIIGVLKVGPQGFRKYTHKCLLTLNAKIRSFSLIFSNTRSGPSLPNTTISYSNIRSSPQKNSFVRPFLFSPLNATPTASSRTWEPQGILNCHPSMLLPPHSLSAYTVWQKKKRERERQQTQNAVAYVKAHVNKLRLNLEFQLSQKRNLKPGIIRNHLISTC